MATQFPVTGTTSTVKNGYEVVAVAANFATVSMSADECVLSNRLSPLDQEERLTYRARPIERVDSSLQIRNPAPVRSGVQYQIVLEETIRTTIDGSTDIVDEPLVMMLTVRHPRSGNINSAVLKQAFRRFMGCIMLPGATASDGVLDMSASGKSGLRFEDLARFAETPVRDSMNTTADA